MPKGSNTKVTGLTLLDSGKDAGRYLFDLRHRDPLTGIVARATKLFPRGEKWGVVKGSSERLRTALVTGAYAKQKAEAAAVAATIASDATPALTFGAFSIDFMKRQKANPKLRPSTIQNKKGHLATHLVPAFGERPIASITAHELRDFVIQLRDHTPPTPRGKPKKGAKSRTHLAAITVRNIIATLSDVLEEALEEGHIASNPCAAKMICRELPQGERRCGAHVTIHLSRSEVERLLTCEAVPEVRRLRYLLACTTGLRVGELTALEWTDVHLDEPIPFLEVTKTYSPKFKGGPPKTKHGRRRVPLHRLAVRALRAAKSKSKSVRVLPDLATGGAAEILRNDLALAGCPTKYQDFAIDFHATRRSFATWLAEEDISEGVRARLMGHASTTVTDAYTAKELAKLREAVESIRLDLSAREIVRMPLQVVV